MSLDRLERQHVAPPEQLGGEQVAHTLVVVGVELEHRAPVGDRALPVAQRIRRRLLRLRVDRELDR